MAGSPATEHRTNNHNRADEESREAKRSVERATRDAGEVTKETTERGEEQVTEALGTARETGERTSDFARMGLRSAAEVQGQIAAMSHDQGRKGIRAAAIVTDIYRETTESTAQDVQALMTAFSELGLGAQQMQHAWFELINRSLEHATRRPQDLLRCGSPVELAEAQRDLYRDGVAYMVDATTTMLDLIGRTAAHAGRSLESHARTGGRG